MPRAARILVRSAEIHGGDGTEPRIGCDVLVEDGEIAAIAPEMDEEAEVVIQSGGHGGPPLLVVPALIDLHCHLREPGFEHKETIATGCRAAAAGGFGQVCCMPNTRPAIDSEEVVGHILREAERAGGGVRVHPIGAATIGNQNREPADYQSLKELGCVAISDDGAPIQDGELMREVLEQAAEVDVPFVAHCEFRGPGEELDPDIPAENEWRAVERNLALAIDTGARLHVAHLSTQAGLEALRQALKDTDRISAEVCPHHLILSRQDRIRVGPNAKVSPPLREEPDTRALTEALVTGAAKNRHRTSDIRHPITIATDHAPHAAYEKERGMLLAPPGMIGLETCLPLVYTHLVSGQWPVVSGQREAEGYMDLANLIPLLTTSPAQIFGLLPPRLAEGEAARFAVFERGGFVINEGWIASKSQNTPFLGFEVNLRHRATVLGEEVLVRDWEMVERVARGEG